MWKLPAWISGLVMVIVGLWELEQAGPHLSRLVTGLLLVGISSLAGLRIGYDSANTLVQDTIRLNKVIMEQNQELIELNIRYMKLRSSDPPVSSKPQQNA